MIKIHLYIIRGGGCLMVINSKMEKEKEQTELERKQAELERKQAELERKQIESGALDPPPRPGLFGWFLWKALPDEKERAVLQKFCGAAMAVRSSYPIEKMMFLHGEPYSGKSVFLGCMAIVFRNKYTGSMGIDELVMGKEALYNVNELQGKHINIGHTMWGDAAFWEPHHVGKVEQFIRGETMNAVWRDWVYGDGRGVGTLLREVPLHIEEVREIPGWIDDDYYLSTCFSSRVSGADIDPNLLVRLGNERDSILNWVIEGWRMFVNDYEKDKKMWLRGEDYK